MLKLKLPDREEAPRELVTGRYMLSHHDSNNKRTTVTQQKRCKAVLLGTSHSVAHIGPPDKWRLKSTFKVMRSGRRLGATLRPP